MHYKACPYCGRIHRAGYECPKKPKRKYSGGEERKLRNTYAWTKKSKEIRDKAQGLCEVCRDNGIITYKGLEVHHITKLAEDKDKLLDNSNLVCLCTKHHKEADKGLLSKTYLEELVRKREQG